MVLLRLTGHKVISPVCSKMVFLSLLTSILVAERSAVSHSSVRNVFYFLRSAPSFCSVHTVF